MAIEQLTTREQVDLVGAQEDQMQAQFIMIFNQIPGVTGFDEKNIALRIQDNVDIPERTVSVYDTWYRGIKIPKVGGIQETVKEMTLTVRLDQDWAIYDAFRTWSDNVYNYWEAKRGPEANTHTNFKLLALNANNDIVKTIIFYRVKIRGMKLSPFNMGEGNPITCELKFIFADYDVLDGAQ